MQMAGANGSLAAYTTLRDIPDDALRAEMQETFPSLFDGDQVNLANRITDIAEADNEINTHPHVVEVTNADGIQYIFSHRAYKGGGIQIQASEETTIPFFKIYHDGVGSISLININTPNGIDLVNSAPNIYAITIANNAGIKSLDLSGSELIGQRSVADEVGMAAASNFHIEACPQLEELNLLPEEARVISQIELCNLPKLEKVDLSELDALYYLRLGQLGECDITYLIPKKWFVFMSETEGLGEASNEYSVMWFGITEDIYERQGTKDFLEEYHANLANGGISTRLNVSVESFDWTQYYDSWIFPWLR
jgi:hypothetical protein